MRLSTHCKKENHTMTNPDGHRREGGNNYDKFGSKRMYESNPQKQFEKTYG